MPAAQAAYCKLGRVYLLAALFALIYSQRLRNLPAGLSHSAAMPDRPMTMYCSYTVCVAFIMYKSK